jgi:hypothetical protein
MNEAATELSARFADMAALEELMSRPSEALVQALRAAPGDIMVLGSAASWGRRWPAWPNAPILRAG